MNGTEIIALAGIIATFIGTLGAALGATILADSHARKQAEAARTFTLQDDARALVVTILVEGRAWEATASSVSMVSAAADSLQEVDEYFRRDHADSWTGQEMRSRGESLTRAITEARILIQDPPLRAAIVHLETLQNEWWASVIDPIRELFRAGQADKVERLRPLWRWQAKLKHSIEAIERLATETIASPLRASAVSATPQSKSPVEASALGQR